MFRKLLAFAVIGWFAGPAMAQVGQPAPSTPGSGKQRALAAPGEWTGYITDTHCGMKGANKTHTAGCVESCMKGGSQAQILSEADNQVYNLDSFEKVKGLVGVRITLKGTLSPDGKKITVASAEKAKSPELP
jgi:hypothetical protein